MNVPRLLGTLLIAVSAFVADPSARTVGPPAAQASVSIAVTLDELVQHADLAVVGEAVETRSTWENVGGSRRIVTYTRIASPEVTYGEPPSSLWVRTLGGVVGRIGQQVSGEARLPIGSRSLLFLTKAPDGALVVTARAQGHYLVVRDDRGTERLRPSPDVGSVVTRDPDKPTARDELDDRELAPALKLVSSRRERRHAPR